MVNIVSSAITNAPPPKAIANMLDRRNKLHHLDEYTDENLMPIFYKNPDGKTNTVNRTTLPCRNFCIITEHAGLWAKQPVGGDSKEEMLGAHAQKGGIDDVSSNTPESGTTRRYALDVSIRAEINPKDPEGRTIGYGFSIPSLEL